MVSRLQDHCKCVRRSRHVSNSLFFLFFFVLLKHFMLGVSILWDVETQQARSVLQGHSNYVFCVSFNPMGNIIASGSFDESIKLWDVRSGSSCISTLPAHSDPVCSIDWNKDGTLLASASYDGNLRLWSPDSSVCLK